MRLIDADALMQTLGITDMDCEKCEWGDYNHCIRGGDFEDACSAIENAPTIEPERKKGRWIMAVGTSGIRRSKCSECGKYYPHDPEFPFNVPSEYNYCPNCGAYMGGDT